MLKRFIFILVFFVFLASTLYSKKNNGAIVLIGGGYCPEAIEWIFKHTNNRKLLILSNDDIPMYWTFGYEKNAIEMLVVDSRDSANSDKTIQKIESANAILISGGVQNDYIRLWKGTKLAEALNKAALRVPVSGVSAGLAIMGEYYYSAENNTVNSYEALLNPYNEFMASIQNNFLKLPYMNDIITDSHYSERDRHGRHLVFMARILNDRHTARIRGIGIDENTALCIDNDGKATVVGSGKCYLIENISFPRICIAEKCLLWKEAIKMYTFGVHETFNIKKWNFKKFSIYEAEDGKIIRL